MICKYMTEYCIDHAHCQTCSHYREFEASTDQKSVPTIEIASLISWLKDQKYRNVDENSDSMTEEFEREHQWELSRNCFINKMIKKLEEIK